MSYSFETIASVRPFSTARVLGRVAVFSLLIGGCGTDAADSGNDPIVAGSASTAALPTAMSSSPSATASATLAAPSASSPLASASSAPGMATSAVMAMTTAAPMPSPSQSEAPTPTASAMTSSSAAATASASISAEPMPSASMTAGMPDAGVPSGYQPCPDGAPCKILPFGDSITEGMVKVGSNYEMNGGYRVELFRQAVLASKSITFVGSRPTNGPDTVEGQPFPKEHEGTSGIKIGEINAKVPSPALDDDPNIILVHIGTNDMVQNTADPNQALDDLLDDLIAGAPDALIVVSSIIPLTSASAKVMTFNQHVVEAIDARADSAHIEYVDQFADFPTEELGDGVHPNETGYARMGQKWFDAIEQYLK